MRYISVKRPKSYPGGDSKPVVDDIYGYPGHKPNPVCLPVTCYNNQLINIETHTINISL
jgi:hypothetical protein